MKKNKVFMSGKWEDLIMANYVCDPKILLPYLPKGTEIDFWNGNAYLSLVAFTFSDARMFNIPIPFHGCFPEINLRFYVKYKSDEEWRKGVVFIKEAAPKLAVALTARLLYHENFVCIPMRKKERVDEHTRRVEYYWQVRNQWNFMKVKAEKSASAFTPDTEEEFIAEHYWAYTPVSAKKTVQYLIEHRPWKHHHVFDFSIHCRAEEFYGTAFKEIIVPKPSSVILVNGSAVKVRSGDNIVTNHETAIVEPAFYKNPVLETENKQR